MEASLLLSYVRPSGFGLFPPLRMTVEEARRLTSGVCGNFQNRIRIWYHAAPPCSEEEMPSLTNPNLA